MVATLSLSASDFSSDCREVVMHMRLLGLMGDVTPNTTIIDGEIERGCRATLVSKYELKDVKTLWTKLESIYNLTCAHVKIESDTKSGCVLDVIRPSCCPGNLRASVSDNRIDE